MNTAESRKPLLLFVAPYFPPACYCGVVQVYLGLLRDLHEFRVVIVSDTFATNAEACRTWDEQAPFTFGFEVRRINAFELHLPLAPSSLRSRIRFARRFFTRGRQQWQQLLDELHPDLILCGGTYSAGWLVLHSPGEIPVLNYIHGEELTMQLRPRWLQPYFRRQQFRLLRRAALNLCVSRYTTSLAVERARMRMDRITLFPNAIDPQRFHEPRHRDVLRERFGWTDRLVLYTLARLEPRKGVDQTLRALAQLARSNELPGNWLYVIAGRGEQQPTLRALAAELGIAERVHFLGLIPDDELAPRYQAADIFLQTNREIRGDTEGFGIVFLEAGACGLPVIGGIAGGTADAIEDNRTGFLVDAENINAIAKAIHTLAWDASLRQRMGHDAAERARSYFALPAARERFLTILKTALPRPSPDTTLQASSIDATAREPRGPDPAHEL